MPIICDFILFRIELDYDRYGAITESTDQRRFWPQFSLLEHERQTCCGDDIGGIGRGSADSDQTASNPFGFGGNFILSAVSDD